jgi:hypothetical protein
MQMDRLQELWAELKLVFFGRGTMLLDSLFPPLIFLLANALVGLNVALWGALAAAGVFAAYRIIRKENLVYALAGLGGVLLAAVFVRISGSDTGFYLPGLLNGGLIVVACTVSVLLKRPLVAWSSFIVRRWPLAWYWHPRVRPAYSEVTILWAVAFAARLAVEFGLLQREAANTLGAVRLFLGWPFTILLLIVSYLYGLWRLGHLQGPSVEEFKAGTAPPWEGQKRGF